MTNRWMRLVVAAAIAVAASALLQGAGHPSTSQGAKACASPHSSQRDWCIPFPPPD